MKFLTKFLDKVNAEKINLYILKKRYCIILQLDKNK